MASHMGLIEDADPQRHWWMVEMPDNRSDRPARTLLQHGDVAVWGGVDRLRFHGVLPLADVPHPKLGSQRINLTLRRAGSNQAY